MSAETPDELENNVLRTFAAQRQSWLGASAINDMIAKDRTMDNINAALDAYNEGKTTSGDV